MLSKGIMGASRHLTMGMTRRWCALEEGMGSCLTPRTRDAKDSSQAHTEGWQAREVGRGGSHCGFLYMLCFKKASKQPAINLTALASSHHEGRRLCACPTAACHPTGIKKGSRAPKGP